MIYNNVGFHKYFIRVHIQYGVFGIGIKTKNFAGNYGSHKFHILLPEYRINQNSRFFHFTGVPSFTILLF